MKYIKEQREIRDDKKYQLNIVLKIVDTIKDQVKICFDEFDVEFSPENFNFREALYDDNTTNTYFRCDHEIDEQTIERFENIDVNSILINFEVQNATPAGSTLPILTKGFEFYKSLERFEFWYKRINQFKDSVDRFKKKVPLSEVTVSGIQDKYNSVYFSIYFDIKEFKKSLYEVFHTINT